MTESATIELKSNIESFLTHKVGQPVVLELTADLSHGDLATPIALRIAREQHKNPLEVAEELRTQLTGQFSDLVVEVAPPGYLNIRLSRDDIDYALRRVLVQPISQVLAGQTIVIEYSQPNIAKPMHFGHLRTTIIGESLKRMYASLGVHVIGVNHLGDWGAQFGKLLAAYKRWGTPEALKEGGIREMLRLYVKFHEEVHQHPELAQDGAAEFVKLEQGDQENRQLWQLMRDVSLVEFRSFYDRLGITLDEPEMGESDYEFMLRPLIDDALGRGIAEESDGALIIRVGDDIPPLILRKSDGATIYATRDLAQIKYRVERWHPDQLLYVVAADQSLHFTQVFRATRRLANAENVRLVHIPYGLVNLPDGKKMSTRAGQVIFLEDVLNEAVNRAKALIIEKSQGGSNLDLDRVSEQVGVGAVKYQVLNQNRQSTIVFAWDKMLSLQGNTGPYIQYTIARANSLLTKADWRDNNLPIDGNDDESRLMRQLVRFSWVLERAVLEYAPNHLTDWLYQISSDFNAFYEKYPVLSADKPDRQRRLAITKVVRDTLVRGLNLLGIEAPERL